MQAIAQPGAKWTLHTCMLFVTFIPSRFIPVGIKYYFSKYFSKGQPLHSLIRGLRDYFNKYTLLASSSYLPTIYFVTTNLLEIDGNSHAYPLCCNLSTPGSSKSSPYCLHLQLTTVEQPLSSQTVKVQRQLQITECKWLQKYFIHVFTMCITYMSFTLTSDTQLTHIITSIM